MRDAVCPMCMNADAVVSMVVGEFGDADTTFSCDECEESFSLAEIEGVLTSWAGWLAWIKSSPGYMPARTTNAEGR